jgi:hypothetical protein
MGRHFLQRSRPEIADPRASRRALQGRSQKLIYVSPHQLKQVEYLIQQSIQGNHVLFTQDDLKRVFRPEKSRILSEEESYEVEHHIERLILIPSLVEKRIYLEKLDTETFEKVLRTYFNIVENNLYENIETRH